MSPAYSSSPSAPAVIQQTEWAYDRNGNVTLSTFKQRFDDQTGSQVGTLGNPASSGTTAKARVSYGQFFYDVLNREIAEVNVERDPGRILNETATAPPTRR